MPLPLKLAIAVLALGLSAFAVFGDSVFVAMGLPSGSGRIVIAAVLLIIGVIWFVWSGVNVRKTLTQMRGRTRQD